MRPTWVFDVDGTLIDSLVGDSLRPGAAVLLEHLSGAGAEIVLWSAGGADYAESRATNHGLGRFVTRYASKDGRDSNGAYQVDSLGRPLDQLVFVDDRPEDMPVGGNVIAVSPYISHHPHDKGLRAAFELAGVGLTFTETSA